MAIERNVRLKVRVSVIEEEIPLRGHPQRRPGKRPIQSKHVHDLPVMELPVAEWQQRMADTADVLIRGWELVNFEPPEIFIGDINIDAVNLLRLTAKVVSNNWSTTCGFEIDINPEFSTAVTELADNSPVQWPDPVNITGWFDAFFVQGWTLYIRAYADDGDKLVYSIVKSVYLPILP